MPARWVWTKKPRPPCIGATLPCSRARTSWPGCGEIREFWKRPSGARCAEPTRSVYEVAALEDSISDAYGENRLRTVLLASFAAAAILLAAVGLYGAISYTVNVRRREVGLRLALGAMRTQVVGHFVGSGMVIAGVGCAVGLGMAVMFLRILSGMLYGVSSTDPATLAAVVAGVLGVSAAAALVPAVRAARVDPMVALRDE